MRIKLLKLHSGIVAKNLSGMDADKYFEKAELKLGEELIQAFNSCLILGFTNQALQIEKWVKALDLPPSPCSHCNETVMQFFNYHLAQGICEKCVASISAETKDEL